MLIDYLQFEAIAQQLQQSLKSMGLIDKEIAFTYTPEHQASLGKENEGFGTAFIHIGFKDSSCSAAFYEAFQSCGLPYKYRGTMLCTLDLAIADDHPLNDPVRLADACQALADKLNVQLLPPNDPATVLASIASMNQASTDAKLQGDFLSKTCAIM